MANNENRREYVVTGVSVEKENRIDGDRLLLNTIESERDERMEATREIMNTITTLGMNDVEIYDRLRKHEAALNSLVGFAFGLLILMIVIVWQTLN